MFTNPKPIPMADNSAETFVIRKDCRLSDQGVTIQAGSIAYVKTGEHVSVTGRIVGDNGVAVDVYDKKIDIKSILDLYRPGIIKRCDMIGPARSRKARKASVRYVGGRRVFRTKRDAFVEPRGYILLGGAYIGVTDGNWYAHGFAVTPDRKDCRVVSRETISEDDAKYVLGAAGYTDVTERAHRNPENYPRPRPRTAPRKRCPNAGQASLLGSMGVSDDR